MKTLSRLFSLILVVGFQLSAQERFVAKATPAELKNLGVEAAEVIPGWSAFQSDSAAAERLKRSQIYVEIDHKIEIYSQAVDDSLFFYQWGLGDFRDAWAITTGDPSVKIGILDTGSPLSREGIWTHPDLDSSRFIIGPVFLNGGSDGMFFAEGDSDLAAADYSGHATHVAGIIGATSDNGIGVKGIDQKAKIVTYKIFTKWGWGYWSWAANATYRAVHDGCRVLNMSFGGGSYSRVMEEALLEADRRGVISVVAAGNTGSETQSFPAFFGNFSTKLGYREGFKKTVISVGSVNRDGLLSSFTSRGWFVDVYAPGGKGHPIVDPGNILSTMPTYYSVLGGFPTDTSGGGNGKGSLFPEVQLNYGYLAGTSMAAPHVTGTISLMFAANPKLPSSKVKEIIMETADSIRTVDGVMLLLNPGKAVRVAKSMSTTTAVADNAVSEPRGFTLYQNYPNPFNPATTIVYELDKVVWVNLKVFNILGQEVLVLADGWQEAGLHSVHFSGASLPSGIYFYRLTAGDEQVQKKMMLLK